MYKCEKSPRLAAKVSHEINNIPTCENFFLPYLACISADYVFFLKLNVTALSTHFCVISKAKNCLIQTSFFTTSLQLFK